MPRLYMSTSMLSIRPVIVEASWWPCLSSTLHLAYATSVTALLPRRQYPRRGGSRFFHRSFSSQQLENLPSSRCIKLKSPPRSIITRHISINTTALREGGFIAMGSPASTLKARCRGCRPTAAMPCLQRRPSRCSAAGAPSGSAWSP